MLNQRKHVPVGTGLEIIQETNQKRKHSTEQPFQLQSRVVSPSIRIDVSFRLLLQRCVGKTLVFSITSRSMNESTK